MNQSTWVQASTNKTAAATASRRPERWSRLVSATEVLVVTFSILGLIWVLQPLGSQALDFGVRFLVVSAMVASNILHGDNGAANRYQAGQLFGRRKNDHSPDRGGRPCSRP